MGDEGSGGSGLDDIAEVVCCDDEGSCALSDKCIDTELELELDGSVWPLAVLALANPVVSIWSATAWPLIFRGFRRLTSFAAL